MGQQIFESERASLEVTQTAAFCHACQTKAKPGYQINAGASYIVVCRDCAQELLQALGQTPCALIAPI